MKISKEELSKAMDTEFDGIGLWVVVQEVLELRKKVKELEELNNTLKIHKFHSEGCFEYLEKKGIGHIDHPPVPQSE